MSQAEEPGLSPGGKEAVAGASTGWTCSGWDAPPSLGSSHGVGQGTNTNRRMCGLDSFSEFKIIKGKSSEGPSCPPEQGR